MQRSADPLHNLSQLRRAPDAHKGDAGKVVLLGGNTGMVGAALLAGRTAMYAGAGWVVLGLCAPDAPSVDPLHPELMLLRTPQHDDLLQGHMNSADALAIGPGLGQDPHAVQLLCQALHHPAPLVLDADALNLLASHPDVMQLLQKRADPLTTLLTPHPGEAARLLGVSVAQVQADRAAAAQALADLARGLVVLKGAGTLCAAPSACAYPQIHCPWGNPGMAAAGMGDVLTGLIVSLAAQGRAHHASLWQAAVWGVHLHAQAADVLCGQAPALIGLRPSELGPAIRQLMHVKMNPSV
jgi:hydroxyethylthiazole kinase-like uncharacterized protein yjeF